MNILNSDAVETCMTKEFTSGTFENNTAVTKTRESSENELCDDDNVETSEMGDLSYSNQSCLNQSNLSQPSSQKSTSLENTKQDEANYHLHRIKKTTKLVRRCIRSDLKFPPSVVCSVCKLLNTPDQLTLDQIEELNLKCQSALQTKHSSESGTESDDKGLITFKSQLIAPKNKGKSKKTSGISDDRSSPKHSSSSSQSAFAFGQPQPQQTSVPYFQQHQGYPYPFSQPPTYAPPPNFAGYQYPPNQYSQTPQFKFGTQTFTYNTKPESFQTPFCFQNLAFNKTGSKSPISPPEPTMSSTPKPDENGKRKVKA